MALAATAGAGCGSCGSDGDRAARKKDAGAEVVPTRFKTLRMQAESSARNDTPRDMPPVPRIESVRLLDPGKGRRRALRYRLDERTRALVITARLETRRMAAGDWEPQVALPAIRYGLRVGRTPDGLLSVRGIEAQREEAAANGEDAARAARSFLGRYRANLEGRRATAALSDRGLLGEVTPVAGSGGDAAKAEANDEANDEDKANEAKDPAAPGPHTRQEVQQLLLESVVPFPQELVAQGARWQVVSVLRRGAGVVKQVAEYELLEAGEDRLRIAARLEQNGEHQVVQSPDLPAGTMAELLALVWRARGELVISPAAATPLSGTLDVEYRVHSRLERGLERNEYFVESKGKIELASEVVPQGAEDAAPKATDGATDGAADAPAPEVGDSAAGEAAEAAAGNTAPAQPAAGGQ